MNKIRGTILIVDDNELNCDILDGILSTDYNTIIVHNGQEALDFLTEKDTHVSAILLDMQMPVMDGFTLLSILQKDQNFEQIPVIITTASNDAETEVRCLNSGATDFITKPFNPDVVRARLNNAIHLHESVLTLSAIEYDETTGLYTRGAFLRYADELLQYKRDSRFDLLVAEIFDFERLKAKYGNEKPEALLKTVASLIVSHRTDRFITAHFGSGVFAALVEVGEDAPEGEERIRIFRENFENNSPIPKVNIKYGIYENVEHNLPAQILCERAICIPNLIRHQYAVKVGKYSSNVQKEIDLVEMIESNMETALEKNQFQIYYQPKISISNGKDCIAGAEALVRWIHPTLGFMNPGIFIPLFEKNGFITRLDEYVFKHVCSDIKEWHNKGLIEVPISINLSRVDFSIPDLSKKIIKIVNEYGIPHNLLHFEITESAFSANDAMIKQTMHDLHENGFMIELDDFGAGYSTLSSLHSFDIDIIKIDMSLIKEEKSERGISILKFAHRLAHMLKMKVVQEGVETKEQLERVRSLGCDYVQGYYFSKPLSKEDYESLFLKDPVINQK